MQCSLRLRYRSTSWSCHQAAILRLLWREDQTLAELSLPLSSQFFWSSSVRCYICHVCAAAHVAPRCAALRCCSRQACPSKKHQPLIQSIAHFAGATYTKLYRMDVSVYVPTPARAVLAGAIWAMNVVDFDLEDDWGGERKGVRSTDDDYYD
jgi:hypothetical protein